MPRAAASWPTTLSADGAPVSSATKLSGTGAAARLTAIERQRRQAGLSQAELCAAADLSSEWYRTVLAAPQLARSSVLARLEAALRRLAGAGRDAAPLAAAVYAACLALAAMECGLDPAAVRAADPRRGATADPAWRQAALARQVALYAMNTMFGLRQRLIAAAAGLTPAAVCLALRSIEDRRDDAAMEALLVRLERLLTGAA